MVYSKYRSEPPVVHSKLVSRSRTGRQTRAFQPVRCIAFWMVATLTAVLMPSYASGQLVTPGSTVAGKSIAEWTAEWNSWAFSFPASNSPLLDTTGERAYLGDVGPVFFMESSLGTSFSVKFTVPSDKFLLLPVFASIAGNAEGFPPRTIDELRAANAAVIAGVSNIHVSIDNVDVADVLQYREQSPVFSINLPPTDNIFQTVFGLPIAGTISPAVSDGYWIMMTPMALGSHVITLGETLPNGQAVSKRYNISSVPEPPTLALCISSLVGLLLLLPRRQAVDRGRSVALGRPGTR